MGAMSVLAVLAAREGWAFCFVMAGLDPAISIPEALRS
jgi:hypothetical protein